MLQRLDAYERHRTMLPKGDKNAWPRYLLIYYYYTVVMGLTSQWADPKTLKIVKILPLVIYARCMNVALIVGMMFAFRACMDMPSDGYGSGNELLRLTDLINLAMQFSMTMCMLLLRFRRERRYMTLMYRLRTFDTGFMRDLQLDAATHKHFSRMLLAKFVVSCGRVATTIIIPLQLYKEISVKNILLLIYFSNMLMLLPAIVFRYYCALLEACRRYALLNGELRRLLVLPADVPIADTLHEFAAVHWQLSSMVHVLSDEFKYQMVATLISYLLHNINYGFYAALLIGGATQDSFGNRGPLAIGLGMIAFSLMYMDIYLFYWVCEKTTQSYAETSHILRLLQTKGGHSATKEVEWLSLQLVQRKLHISMGGMFNLNFQALLSLFAYSLQHTLIWVQFDHQYYSHKKPYIENSLD